MPAEQTTVEWDWLQHAAAECCAEEIGIIVRIMQDRFELDRRLVLKVADGTVAMIEESLKYG